MKIEKVIEHLTKNGWDISDKVLIELITEIVKYSNSRHEAIEEYKKRLHKIEAELEKVRGCSPITHGWQTQKYAKASRKWDILAQKRMEILNKIDTL